MAIFVDVAISLTHLSQLFSLSVTNSIHATAQLSAKGTNGVQCATWFEGMKLSIVLHQAVMHKIAYGIIAFIRYFFIGFNVVSPESPILVALHQKLYNNVAQQKKTITKQKAFKLWQRINYSFVVIMLMFHIFVFASLVFPFVLYAPLIPKEWQ